MPELKRNAVPLAAVARVLVALTIWSIPHGRLVAVVAMSMVVTCAVALVLWRRVRWLNPVVVPLLVTGVLAQFRPQSDVSLAVLAPAVLGFAAAVLLAAGVDVNRGLDHVLAAAGRIIEAVVGGLAFCLIVIPAWAWTRLRRRGIRGRAERAGPAWSVTGDHGAPSSLASSPEVIGTRRSAFGKMTWAIGCVTLLLALNFGVGWLWDQAYPTGPPGAAAAQVRGEPTTQLPADPRASGPAMAAYPWRNQYFNEIAQAPGGYWPFTEYRPADYTTKYVNQRGWTRVSYEPKGDPDTMPTVWMFGGSTTWGEGQRDKYTIASYLSRIAEQAGTPLRISNFGSRGWVHFQEMLLYEQRLALQKPPDVALFYDGANEINAQSMLTEAVPANVWTYAYAKKLTGSTIASQFRQSERKGAPSLGDALAAYNDHSAIHKLADYFRSAKASASPVQDGSGTGTGPDLGTGIDDQPSADADGQVQDYHITVQDGIDAAKVYERGKDLTLHLSQKYGVDTLLYWQPLGFHYAPQDKAASLISSSTIDIGDALDGHHEVFLDGGHTNEEGARIVAERIWKDLGPKVRAWYGKHQ